MGPDNRGGGSERTRRVALVAVVVLGSLAGCFGVAAPNETTPAVGAPAGTETATPADARSATADARSVTETPVGATGDALSIHFIHVGQGTSVLVIGPSGETLLYDTGNWRDDGEQVLDYLAARNVTRIDYLVTSHADADHVGGHAAVVDHFEREKGGIGAIYDPGIAAGTRTYEAYLDAVERHDVTLYRTRAGDEIPMAGASVRALAPPEGYLADRERNENSLVLRITLGNASVLLPGDAGREAERYLTEKYDSELNATALAAAHHGSNTSSGRDFLAAATPRIAVIQSAYDSPYGHPHREVLARFATRGVSTYWTGVHGDVMVETDGERVAVRSQRDAPTDPLELRTAPGVEPGANDALERRASFAVGADPLGDSPGTVAADGGRETANPAEAPDLASALELATVHADARDDDRENLDDEYLVFRNAGDDAIDLSGWTVSDEADHRYTFPEGTSLAPDATLTLYTGPGESGDGDYYWNASGPVWNNAGDTVFVRTAQGRLVLEETYDG